MLVGDESPLDPPLPVPLLSKVLFLKKVQEETHQIMFIYKIIIKTSEVVWKGFYAVK